MKLIRVAIIFAAGVYFGSHAEDGGGLSAFAQSVQEAVAQLQDLRR
jgi:hypothetical protein